MYWHEKQVYTPLFQTYIAFDVDVLRTDISTTVVTMFAVPCACSEQSLMMSYLAAMTSVW